MQFEINMNSITIYDDIACLIASLNPRKLFELKAPKEAQARFSKLLKKERNKGLSIDEKDELDHYIILERLIRHSKAHARKQLNAL